jgi:hypothetical protein
MVLNYKKYNESIYEDFKIGDRVITKDLWKFSNKYATIVRIDHGGDKYCIEFDEFIDGHSCSGKGKKGHCTNASIKNLIKIEKEEPIKEEDIEWFESLKPMNESFEIGDIVVCLETKNDNKGRLNFLEGKEYQLLRGMGDKYLFIQGEQRNLELFRKDTIHKYFKKVDISNIKEEDIEWF